MQPFIFASLTITFRSLTRALTFTPTLTTPHAGALGVTKGASLELRVMNQQLQRQQLRYKNYEYTYYNAMDEYVESAAAAMQAAQGCAANGSIYPSVNRRAAASSSPYSGLGVDRRSSTSSLASSMHTHAVGGGASAAAEAAAQFRGAPPHRQSHFIAPPRHFQWGGESNDDAEIDAVDDGHDDGNITEALNGVGSTAAAQMAAVRQPRVQGHAANAVVDIDGLAIENESGVVGSAGIESEDEDDGIYL